MIIGRRLAKELGYVTYPCIPLPKLDSAPVKQTVIPMLKIQESTCKKDNVENIANDNDNSEDLDKETGVRVQTQ